MTTKYVGKILEVGVDDVGNAILSECYYNRGFVYVAEIRKINALDVFLLVRNI
jgi:hypothetical protein